MENQKSKITLMIDAIIRFFKRFRKKITPHVVEATYENEIMSVKYSDGSEEQYKGNCTVWRTMPMMKSCSLSRREKLSEIWSYIEHHGNPYPTAHKPENLKTE